MPELQERMPENTSALVVEKLKKPLKITRSAHSPPSECSALMIYRNDDNPPLSNYPATVSANYLYLYMWVCRMRPHFAPTKC